MTAFALRIDHLGKRFLWGNIDHRMSEISNVPGGFRFVAQSGTWDGDKFTSDGLTPAKIEVYERAGYMTVDGIRQGLKGWTTAGTISTAETYERGPDDAGMREVMAGPVARLTA